MSSNCVFLWKPTYFCDLVSNKWKAQQLLRYIGDIYLVPIIFVLFHNRVRLHCLFTLTPSFSWHPCLDRQCWSLLLISSFKYLTNLNLADGYDKIAPHTRDRPTEILKISFLQGWRAPLEKKFRSLSEIKTD